MMTLTSLAPVVTPAVAALWPDVRTRFFAKLRQNNLPQERIDAMLGSLKVYEFEASSGTLWMLVGSVSPKSWLERTYIGLLTECWQTALPTLLTVQVEVAGMDCVPGKKSSELHDVRVGRHDPKPSPMSHKEVKEMVGLRPTLPYVQRTGQRPRLAPAIPPEVLARMMAALMILGRHHEVDPMVLRQRNNRKLQSLRKLAIYLVHHGVEGVEIAYMQAFFGNLHKNSVISALKQTEERRQTNHGLSLDIASMLDEVKAEVAKVG